MGSNYSKLDIIVCGFNGINLNLVTKLFPNELRENERQLRNKEDKMIYNATIFNDSAISNQNLIRIVNLIKEKFNREQQNKVLEKMSFFVFQKKLPLLMISNKINELPELKLPFIVFLSYGEIIDIRNNVYQGGVDIFKNFKDKRKISILRLLKNENEENIEMNYRTILSYLFELNQIYNQLPFKPSNNPIANLFRMQEEDLGVTIKIILTGFSRKGKSTFINMIFDKIVTLESPSFIPVTSKIIEFLLPSQPRENQEIKGGLKIFDVPGLVEGTHKNMNNVLELINKSIEDQEYNHEVINYIVFFLQPGTVFNNIDNFLRRLNDSGIKVIFVSNRDQPKENNEPNTTKDTLKSYLEDNGFNNLVIENGNNIIEVNLIKGLEGRTNEIFKYIYNDLIINNRIDQNMIQHIQQLNENNLFNYLHSHLNIFSRIRNVEDLIDRGNKKSNIIIYTTISLVTCVGFCPIPFVDVPIFLLLTATMLIKIFKSYGYRIEYELIRDFFRKYHGENLVRNIIRNQENNINNNLFNVNINERLGEMFRNIQNENTKFIINELIKSAGLRIGLSTIAGFLDFIPLGFIAGGILDALVNGPYLKRMGEKAKKFCANTLRNQGAKINVLNMIEGYKDSFDILNRLGNRNDWSRKIQILD